MNLGSEIDWKYMGKESALILFWAYIVFIGGTINGYVNYKIQVMNFAIGFILIAAWLVTRLYKREKIAGTGLEKAIIVFLGSLFISVIFSQDVRRSLSTLAIYVSYMLVFYFIVYLLDHGWEKELIEKTLLIVGGVLISFFLYWFVTQYLSWKNLVQGLAYAPEFKQRLYLILGDANLIAAFMNILLPLVIYWLLISKRWFFKAVLALYLVCVLFAQYLASSRGGMIAAAGEVGVFTILWVCLVPSRARDFFFIFWSWLRKRKAVIITLCVGIVTIAAVIGVNVFSYQGDATHAPVASARSIFWGAAIDAFKSDPITGIGLGIYPSAYMLKESMPPGRPYLHAHSIPFTMLVECGLVGILSLVFLVYQVIRIGYISFRRNQQNADFLKRWVVGCAVFVGAGIHGLVDSFIVYFVFGIPVLYYLAVWTTGLDGRDSVKKEFSGIYLLFIGVMLSTFTIFSQYAAYFHVKGIEQAEAGNWENAAVLFDKAANNDPGFGLYWLESGIAHSHIVTQDSITKAIQKYKRGIEIESNYSVNHANLAALYWEDGQKDSAIVELSKAVDLAPRAERYWVVMKGYAHSLGDDDLEKKAEIALSEITTQSESEITLDRVLTSLETGNIEAAIEAASLGWEGHDQDPLTYLALAIIEEYRGDMDLADRYLQVGMWVQTYQNDNKVRLMFERAKLMERMGEEQLSQEYYRMTNDAVTDTTMYGWGAKGFTPYAWFVFQRSSLPVDIVPQFPRLNIDYIFPSR